MAVDTDTLVNDARCIDSCIPQGMQMAVLIKIFASIANMSTETDSLISGAVCINQCIPQGMQLAVLVSLANQILETGGGGGGGSGLAGTIDPEGAVTASPGTTYLNRTNESFWVKSTGVGNTGWLQLI